MCVCVCVCVVQDSVLGDIELAANIAIHSSDPHLSACHLSVSSHHRVCVCVVACSSMLHCLCGVLLLCIVSVHPRT